MPPFGASVVEESVAFYDAADDLPDAAVTWKGREAVPFEMAAGAREVTLPMTRQVWSGFERVKIVIDADFEGEDNVTGAVVKVTVCPGSNHSQNAWPAKGLPKQVVRENGKLMVEVTAEEIGRVAGKDGVLFPSNLEGITLLRKANSPRATGYLRSVDLAKGGFRESFSCDNGKLLIANLDDAARCRPHFILENDGGECEGALVWKVYDQPSGMTFKVGKVVRKFKDGERVEVELPRPERAGCYHVDYTLARKDGYRYSHTVSYAAMRPAGKNMELFTDDFKFSCLAHLERYSMNERRRLMAYMREMGANYTRAGGYYWGSAQPNGPDDKLRNWKRFVKGVDICLENGVERGVSILCGPKWAKDPEVNVRGLAHFPKEEFLSAYVREFAGGLAGRVRNFEGNNEPNLTDWTPELEARYEKMLYGALKAVRPDARFLSGEWGGMRNFCDDFYAKLNPDCWDIWAQHYHNALNMCMGVVTHVEELRRKHGITKPWMGDECANCLTNQHKQAVEMFCKNIYSRGHGAVGMTWYNMRCKGSKKPLPPGELSFGMVTWDMCPRGVYVAFNAYAKLYRKTELKGEAEVYPGVMAWRYEGGDAALYPQWSANPRYVTIALRSETDAQKAEVIDIYGNAEPLEIREGRLEYVLGKDPVTIRLMPLTAKLGKAELIRAEEAKGYNRGVATAEKPAMFRANRQEQYTQLFESSGENDDMVWRSTEDLSGYLYVSFPRGDSLKIRICVDDDVHHPTEKGRMMYTGDGFQLMMAVPGQKGTWELGGAWYLDGTTDVWVWNAPSGVDGEEARKAIRLKAKRNEKALSRTIWYDLSIPLRLLEKDRRGLCESGLMLNAIINDNDGRQRKGYISFVEGAAKDPENFITLEFKEAPDGK